MISRTMKPALFCAAVVFISMSSGTSGENRKSKAAPDKKGNPYVLRVADPGCVPGECLCSGRASPEVRLNETGPGAEELQKGVPCIAADFDGNGFTDFALPGGEGMANVVMNDAGGFWRAVRIDAGGLLELYPPRDAQGERGEPVSKHHGLLVRWVGQNHAVFIWNGEGFSRTLFPAGKGP